MVRVAGSAEATRSLKASFIRLVVVVGVVAAGIAVLYTLFAARVDPDEFGVKQVRFGTGKTGIVERTFTAGLYFVGPGQTMRVFPRGLHVLEASAAHEAGEERGTHRVIDALNIQTSDGYAVSADITLLYRIADPVRVAKDFGWGSLYVDSFVVNTFRNGVLTTLGKINAESFYDEKARIAAIEDAQAIVAKRFDERGFKVEKLLLRNYRYADNYERSLHDKKVAVQLTEKNRKEGFVNEEKAKLQQIESKGNAAITIAESEVNAQISKIRAEAELYSSQKRAQADTTVNVAAAEAKRLKAEALTQAGGRYVVALETMKMFENISGAVMTPEQYVSFVRSAWALIGVSPGAAVPAPQAPAQAGEVSVRAHGLALRLALLVSVAGLGGCAATSSTEVGVRTTLLGPFPPRGSQAVYDPGGVYFVLPVVNAWNTLPISQQNLVMNANPAEGDRKKRDDITFKTKDGNNVYIDVNVMWRIDRANAAHIVSDVGQTVAAIQESVVRPISRSVIRDVFNEITSEEYYHVAVKNRMAEMAKQKLEQELLPFGILVDMLQVQQHRFDPEYQNAINAQKQAEANVQTLIEQQKNIEVQKKSELEAKRAEWNRTIEDALGQAGKTRNDADGYYQTKTNEAKAMIAVAEAEAEGVRKEAEALGKLGGDAYVKMQVSKLLAQKKVLIVPGSNVSTMNVNQMIEWLTAHASEPH